ncbi:MAG: hypothetical protein JW838_02085, partial [Spirochaetes bacterium]|nr:hypothetical protein [Spirochaetota bacterium]
MTKKILLIPNMPNWSVDKRARNIIKYNTSDLVIDSICFNEFLNEWEDLHERYDLIFPMTNRLLHEFIQRRIPTDRVVTTITSFASWDGGRTVPPGFNVTPPKSEIRALGKALLVSACCRKLWYLFSGLVPLMHTAPTCDLDMFYPVERKRRSDRLVVGWTGSLSNNENLETDIRGVASIIKPACAAVEGVEFL